MGKCSAGLTSLSGAFPGSVSGNRPSGPACFWALYWSLLASLLGLRGLFPEAEDDQLSQEPTLRDHMLLCQCPLRHGEVAGTCGRTRCVGLTPVLHNFKLPIIPGCMCSRGQASRPHPRTCAERPVSVCVQHLRQLDVHRKGSVSKWGGQFEVEV